ncbi:MAG: Hsp20 family protein [Pyrinomonadaceae bacterium]|nr:Hsp20 family protein [Pyrinomonadaceae bacterium]
MSKQQVALEKKAHHNDIFVEAEHFLEDFAKNTEAIAKRAFELFQNRGYKFGHELEDWFKAERELLKKVPIEIKDIDGNLNIRAEVPGFTAENLKVSVESNKVTIKGETEEKSEKKDKNTLYTEWKSNKIFRTFDLPHRVEADKANATIKDGVLTLMIPKVAETKPNEVEIKPT